MAASEENGKESSRVEKLSELENAAREEQGIEDTRLTDCSADFLVQAHIVTTVQTEFHLKPLETQTYSSLPSM